MTRRDLLARAGAGFGLTALTGILEAAAANPLAAKTPPLPARAKSVISLFMHGGVSHVDSYDYKPRLTTDDGKQLSFDDPRYPRALRFTADPPPVLYVKGRIEPADMEAIAVVGSRAASPYGLAVGERLARELAEAGITVVSGSAVGIDAAAHRGALDAGGRTIAVLGCGIDQVYPVRHRRLAAEIARRGALVSELPFGTPPLGPNFPRRNRIVSGLALGVVVVEANERSGSLITARLALEQGREVFAVPGEAGLDRTRGTHRLLRQGARLAEGGTDVIEDALPWRMQNAQRRLPPADPSISPDAVRMLAAFENVAEHVDRLIERSGFDPSRALQTLLELELAGEVLRRPGMRYSRRSR